MRYEVNLGTIKSHQLIVYIKFQIEQRSVLPGESSGYAVKADEDYKGIDL